MNTKTQHATRSQPVFHLPVRSDLLRGGEPFSMYRGVLVLWTSQYDARVLTWIDELDIYIRNKLIAVSAHKGTIEMLWADGYRHGDEWVEVEGDTWRVNGQWDARTGAPCA